jgi:hypothetical protein
MSVRGLNLLVFRDGRRRVSGAELKSALMSQLDGFSDASPADLKTGVLLCAGEFECAVADAPGGCASSLADLTDVLAEAFLGSRLSEQFQSIRSAMTHAHVPEEMTISAPEGFAYYALQPGAYSQVLDKLPALPERVVVIGIRSIGVTLSAVTAAAARLRGAQTSRFTVRPAGHPYDRRTEFSESQWQIIQSGVSRAAGFLVVDEGPGLSGSSFLSVAEALQQAGVPRERITLLSAHQPNPEALCAANASQRWRKFHCVAAAGEASWPAGTGAFVGGGHWRNRLFQDESLWPAVWSNMERAKYLSPAGDKESRLFKFAGLGHYGHAALEREQCLAAAKFAPGPCQEEHGFVSYPWLSGRPMAAGDLSHEVIVRIAEYCAFRANAFSVSNVDISSLQQMAEHNLAELGLDLPVSMTLERAVIADGHMQPHEWIITPEGKLLKTDSGSHGDDHFYPGPTDIAWDLAGAMVEWQMDAGHSARFLDAYRRVGGDDPSTRIADFIRAYTVFRCAYCKMAANALQGTAEQTRLGRAAAGYDAQLRRAAKSARQAPTQSVPATVAP